MAGLAELVDPALAAWIRSSVAFPNGMVDRITPATGDRERRLVAEAFGIEDKWPAFCEGFKQWVLEDNFPSGRPALETVGVQFVPDVAPYEAMKIRILNGRYAVIAYPAGLLDVHFVHEAMEHPLIGAFLDKVERDEIIPVVPPVPDTDLADYYRLIARRFANPKIGDTVRRLCPDGSNRQPKFIIPSVADRLDRGLEVSGLEAELTAKLPSEIERYQAARQAEDLDTAVLFAGEGVDLINDCPAAGDVVARIVAEAERLLADAARKFGPG